MKKKYILTGIGISAVFLLLVLWYALAFPKATLYEIIGTEPSVIRIRKSFTQEEFLHALDEEGIVEKDFADGELYEAYRSFFSSERLFWQSSVQESYFGAASEYGNEITLFFSDGNAKYEKVLIALHSDGTQRTMIPATVIFFPAHGGKNEVYHTDFPCIELFKAPFLNAAIAE